MAKSVSPIQLPRFSPVYWMKAWIDDKKWHLFLDITCKPPGEGMTVVNLKLPKGLLGRNPNAHQVVNGSANCGTFVQWNITQQKPE